MVTIIKMNRSDGQLKSLADILAIDMDAESPLVQMAMSNDIEQCENEPVLPYLDYLDDCEMVETSPVLL